MNHLIGLCRFRRIIFLFCLLFFTLTVQGKPIEIVLWHSFAGHLGEEMNRLAADFNRTQPLYVVKPVYKGEYIESLTSFAAAFRAKQPPGLIQVFEVGTATMLYPKGIIKPVETLMQEQNLSLPKEDFLPAVRAFYSDENRLLAMPFNTSIPVIFYNVDAVEKAGYNANAFPQTWDELEILAGKLRKAGHPCAYTSAYPGWIQIESFLAIHGLAMIETNPIRAVYNNKAIVNHLERLKRWQKKHYFEYGGRASDATVLFTSGRCPLFSQSSGSHNSLAELVTFRLGLAVLPLDTQISKIRHNDVAGGAALWAVAGQSPLVYRGIAQFFSYLAQPEVQYRWHQRTGYLPLGTKGIYSFPNEVNYPILALAQADLGKQRDDQVRLHIGPQNQIRTINDEALEAIFAGLKTPQQAMNEAVKRANYALLRFARNTGKE
ncbi:extracellular solute-binding protein [Legionella maceachernii]|uniref:sn-glycerol-3-phosphate-binding periplasmic protein UgpB n=1 Tax=Legionella maceachernii TaxID=466 RepID=A0A0W0W0A1_9GAMM|nr:extracellular solute-binding protein [Legionella maceachernii]KTD25743.1 glycerol-3-phosphate-binding periplasmic protein precursor [Legionella maceachernii]SJZ92469.1 carbohydrate ABC transporter substrate-binding protein, CUT1 family (TC 3.A.1.1.-) [Legionella maceachernii]SUP03540.1 glycerol-3-phosphate transporter periplasmic binding protein [Legionella maceachernii]